MKKVILLALIQLCIFSVNAQTKGQIKFTAKIANRNSDTLVIRGANNFKQVIPINKKEIFAATFEAPKGFYQFSDGVEVSGLYLKPNSEINLTMDAKQFDETIVYKGKGVDESNYLAQYSLNNENLKMKLFLKMKLNLLHFLKQRKRRILKVLQTENMMLNFRKG